MIAELHRKISSTGSNLHDRLEDQLTGDVFGALRYVSFEDGLKQLLIKAKVIENLGAVIERMNWQNTKILFWEKFSDGEPDILLVSSIAEAVICMEIKYQSGLSSDDGADFSNNSEEVKDNQHSSHQLSREAEILKKEFHDIPNKILIFIANEYDCLEVFSDTKKRNLINNSVKFGYLSWQDILNSLQNLTPPENIPSRNVFVDIVNLLVKKGFERFKGFICDSDIENTAWEYNSKQNISFNFRIDKRIVLEENYEF